MVITLFLELLQVALNTRDKLSVTPNATQWKELFKLSQVQSVTGILLDGIEIIPETQRPPQNLLLEWIGYAQSIEARYRGHQVVIGKTHDSLVSGGIKAAFMKGLICGSRYPNPSRRQCGDIDFVVAKEDFSKTLDNLEHIGNVDRELIHEHHGMVFVEGVTLEPHYKVHNFQNPQVDKAMREMFEEVFPDKLIHVQIGDKPIPAFPPAFECALLVGHMVNHVYAEGLGMRQVIDFMVFLQKESKAVLSGDCKNYLERMRMVRAFHIFAFICEEYLGMSKELLKIEYTKKEKQFAQKLIEDIMTVGNFAMGANYLGKNKALQPIRSYLWVTGRCIRLCYLCPAEARWWPISKFRRYFLLKKLFKFKRRYLNAVA